MSSGERTGYIMFHDTLHRGYEGCFTSRDPGWRSVRKRKVLFCFPDLFIILQFCSGVKRSVPDWKVFLLNRCFFINICSYSYQENEKITFNLFVILCYSCKCC